MCVSYIFIARCTVGAIKKIQDRFIKCIFINLIRFVLVHLYLFIVYFIYIVFFLLTVQSIFKQYWNSFDDV